MIVSVIIPTYNREKLLCETIDSVIQEINSCDRCSFELIIVDQTRSHTPSVSDYLESVSHDYGFVKLINEEKASLPNARNIGVLNSTGDIIVFLDDDVRLSPNFFSFLIDSYQIGEVSSVVGGVTLVNETDDNILLNNQSSVKRLARYVISFLFCRNKSFAILDCGIIVANTSVSNAGWVDSGRGCNMSFLRSVFDDVGFFDTNYIGNALREETDMFCRMKRQLKRVYYEPQLHVFHRMANIGGCRSESSSYWSNYFFNQCYFYIKNFSASLFKIKCLLLFDLVKCKRSGIKVNTILSEAYSRALSLV